MTALPTPPVDPYEKFTILDDGDVCDARCPARAYVRVHVYLDGDKDTLRGTLHFCSHHWAEVADAFWQMSLDGRCGIIDERHRLTDS